ncbi:PREDICTED: hsc70-interacting protein 1-like [Bactrocera latifrons]|nr:PREDICTED: hsc70-interacting protein 1-like [Bactrocera latifrons]
MAMPNFSHADLEKLKFFINFVSEYPTALNLPQLEFVKEFLEKFGGKVPTGEFKMPTSARGKCPFGADAASCSGMNVDESEESELEESEPESEVELDMEGVIEADTEADQPMGDTNKTPTEEEIDQASALRSQAAAAYSEQKFDEAIDLYTKAIELNPGNALFHAKRGQAFLKLKKPNACIRDCDKALELNCDSAAAYKFRGRAHRLLGNWEKSANDLRQACKLDFDEEADEWLREVTPNAKKLEQHRIKQERKRAERESKKAQHKTRAHAKERKQQQQQQPQEQKPENDIRFDPEFLTAIQDKEFQQMLIDIAKSPENIEKYKSNPKFAKIAEFGNKIGLENVAKMFEGLNKTRAPPSQPEPKAEPKPHDFDDNLD